MTRCYAAPAVRIPILLYGLALVGPSVLIWHFPGPGLPRFVLLRRCRAIARSRARASTSTSSGSSPRSAAASRPSRSCRSPRTPTGCHSRRSSRCRSWLSSDRRPGPSALPFALIGATAAPADLGHRPRRGRAADASRSAPGSSSRSRSCRRVTWPSPTTSPSTSRWSRRPVDGRARPAGLDRAPSRWPACSLASRPCRATMACWCWRALGLAFVWDRWRRARAIAPRSRCARRVAVRRPPSRVSGCSSWSWRRGGCASWRSSGPSRRRPPRGRSSSSATSASGTASRRRRRSTTCSGMGIGPFLATRVGGLVAAVMIYVTLIAGFVLAPFMVIGGWARRRSLDFGPFFLYAALLFAFSTLVSAVHVPGGTFIHSAVALAPHAYILALEGLAVAVAWIAGAARDVERRPRRRPSSPARPSRSRPSPRPSGRCRPRRLGRQPDQVPARGRRPRSCAAPRRRTASCRSTRPGRSTGPAAAGWCSSTTRSRPSSASPARTTSAGSSSTGADSVEVGGPDPRRRVAAGLARRADPASRASRPARRLPGGSPDREPLASCADARRRRSSASRSSSAPSSRPRSSSPKPEDTAYYVGVARNLARGSRPGDRRAVELRDAAAGLPAPAFEVWLPLPTFLAAIPMALFGPTFPAAQV